MKSIKFPKGVVAELTRSGWMSNEPELVKVLNNLSDSISQGVRIGDGDPRQIIFNRIVSLFSPTDIIDDEKSLKSIGGGQY